MLPGIYTDRRTDRQTQEQPQHDVGCRVASRGGAVSRNTKAAKVVSRVTVWKTTAEEERWGL